MVEAIVVSALGIVAAIAPGVLAQLSGKQSDEEAIEAARALASKIPDRTDQGDADTAERLKRG
jgi:hypothetical protein